LLRRLRFSERFLRGAISLSSPPGLLARRSQSCRRHAADIFASFDIDRRGFASPLHAFSSFISLFLPLPPFISLLATRLPMPHFCAAAFD